MSDRPLSPTEGILQTARVIHFVGIGGIGMSALAELMLRQGKRITGSDAKDSALLERLASLGARVAVGHSGTAVHGADLVVATSAARPDNPELVEALRLGIPLVKRADLLGWLMGKAYGIAIAGTHGKTSATAMVAFLLHRAGLDPTVLLGGQALDFESHGLLGVGPYLVAEADEFDRSFLTLWPRVAAITSVEADHLDCYADLEEIAQTFSEFASRIPAEGLLVTCADDPVLRQMELSVPQQGYGRSQDADWRLLKCRPVSPFGTQFSFTTPNGAQEDCLLRLSGEHYALDALAAIAVASFVGVDVRQATESLSRFRGTRRRYELIGEVLGVTIIDDYAHHPTAVKATLRAARERHQGRIWCVFQPHTSNRTEKLLAEFALAFGDADGLLLLPVYHPAGREDESGVTSADLLREMRHPDARLVRGLDGAVRLLEQELADGDLVMTMGAGDVNRVGEELFDRLSS